MRDKLLLICALGCIVVAGVVAGFGIHRARQVYHIDAQREPLCKAMGGKYSWASQMCIVPERLPQKWSAQ